MKPIIKGDTSMWRIPLVNEETLEPLNLTGCSVWVTVKQNAADSDAAAAFQHSMTVDSNGQVIHSDGMSLGTGGVAAGVIIQELTPQESSLLIPGKYVYDVQVMLANGRIFTPILNETEEIVGDITHAITRPGGA